MRSCTLDDAMKEHRVSNGGCRLTSSLDLRLPAIHVHNPKHTPRPTLVLTLDLDLNPVHAGAFTHVTFPAVIQHVDVGVAIFQARPAPLG